MSRSIRTHRPLLAGALLLVAGGVLLPGGAVRGQSLLSGAGIGVPAEPLDARSRALGSVGVGLTGWRLAPADPAAAAGLFLPGATATLQPGRVTPADGVRSGHTRFPLLAASYPLMGSVFSLQLASGLDQRWELRTQTTVPIAGEDVDAIDIYRSTGSLGTVRVGWARQIGESFGVGVNVGSQVGSVQRSFSRSLDPAGVGLGVEPFVSQGRWRASGWTATGGGTWDPSSLVRVAASATWSGELLLRPTAGDAREERRYSMPLELRAGATVGLSPELVLTGGVGWADWSGVAEEMGSDRVRDRTLTWGTGVEWTGSTLLGRTVPIRVGTRSQDLPFHYLGEPSSERSWAGGVGMVLVEAPDFPAAQVDVGVERGERTAGGFSERFLRATVTVRLAGG